MSYDESLIDRQFPATGLARRPRLVVRWRDQSLEGREQNVDIERLGHTRAGAQFGCQVGQVVGCAEHQDGRAGAARVGAAVLEERTAVHDRHHQIEHDRVEQRSIRAPDG